MNAVYSFWSKPYLANGKKIHGKVSQRMFNVCWMLSVYTAKKHFDKVKLVTDTEGYKALVDLDLPFDDISLELDNIPENILPEMWAYGKIVAYEMQNEPFVHIDYDAFIFNPPSEEFLNAGLIVQHKEFFWIINHVYYSNIRKAVKDWGFESEFYYNNVAYGYNCGVFGGNDLEFIKKYVKEAKRLAQFPTIEMLNQLGQEEKLVFPIAFEQHILSAMCYDIKPSIYEVAESKERIEELNYLHILGAKVNPLIEKRLENRLLKDFPDKYMPFVHKTLMKNPENYLSLNSYEI